MNNQGLWLGVSQKPKYLDTKRNRPKTKKNKFVPVVYRCKWCGTETQVTTHRLEKRKKDFCAVWCHRPYYDLIKRLDLKLSNSSLALFTDEMEEKIAEIKEDLDNGAFGKMMNEIFIGYTKAVRTKITKMSGNAKMKLKAKRFLVLNNTLRYVPEYNESLNDLSEINLLNTRK